MTRRDANPPLPKNGSALSFPFPDKHWKAVCGVMGLSGQLERVVELILNDLGDKDIADAMGIGLGTVKVYLARVGKLTNTNGRVQLLIYLLKISHDLSAASVIPGKKQR